MNPQRRALGVLAAFLLLIAPSSPADANRRLIDMTDPETKEYCRKNPDNCQTSISFYWPSLIIGPIMFAIIGASFGLVGTFVKGGLNAIKNKGGEHEV